MTLSIKHFVLLLALTALPVPSLAAATKDTPSHYSLASPYDTIVTHLGSLQESNYHPEIAAKTFLRKGRTRRKARDLAVKLKNLLDEEGIVIELEKLPKVVDYIDPDTKYHRYQLTKLFPEIYLIRIRGQWVYSEETAQSIELLIKEKYPLGMDRLQDFFPDSFQNSFLKLQLWQYTVLALLLLLLRVIYTMLVWICGKLIHRYSRHWAPHYVMLTEKPVGIIAASLVAMLILPAVQLPPVVVRVSFLILKGIITFSTTIVCYHSVSVFVDQFKHRLAEHHNASETQLLPLLKTTLKVLVVTTGFLLTLSNLNIDISTLLAGVSIGGFGVALASQDTIKNLFGSLVIFLDRPFSVGDSISMENLQGRVEEINMRSTRIRTANGSVISIPNAKLANEAIDKYGTNDYQCFQTHLMLACDTPVALIEDFITGAREAVNQHPNTRKDLYYVYVEDAKGGQLKILFHVYFSVTSRTEELACRQSLLLSIVKLAEKLGVKLSS